MSFMELIAGRRSVREYRKKPVESEKIALLVEAALRAPSSRNLDPWEFVVVTDAGILGRLSRAKPHGADFLAGAAAGIVVCADENRSDVWVEDASIASIYIWLAAEALGLGACWVQVRKRAQGKETSARDYVAALLGLPGNLAVESIIAVGYPKRKNPPVRAGKLKYGKVHLNRYGEVYRQPARPLPGGD